ncbi:hypothetical protein DKP76_09990 [Falsochrobactrum shanghaiense]|uniref:Uncharacterized protein n=1 Tax=Falsochrobactrum shanghaiense TaxID=2201899 RepID=A0A316J9Y1_9HYPH|nr:hypothetical protein [Falsochrobactrum shanghaiense]PWL18051.1 hypothetical protein DKP76_09990 [Falsochrobactrum shanghaiense]
MKSTKIILSAIFALGFTVAAHADAIPKRSKDFKANYQTLTQDQKAAPQIAECVASAYDYVKKSKKYDRLGFTQNDIAAAATSNKTIKFSTHDPRKVTSVIAVSGEARPKTNSTHWDSITLRCGIAGGKLKAIELVTTKTAS